MPKDPIAEATYVRPATQGKFGKTSDNLREAGASARRQQIQTHIGKVTSRMKALESKGRELMDRGADEEELDELVEQHRALRGKERFLQRAYEDVEEYDPKELIGMRSTNNELTMGAGESLDRLRKQAEKK